MREKKRHRHTTMPAGQKRLNRNGEDSRHHSWWDKQKWIMETVIDTGASKIFEPLIFSTNYRRKKKVLGRCGRKLEHLDKIHTSTHLLHGKMKIKKWTELFLCVCTNYRMMWKLNTVEKFILIWEMYQSNRGKTVTHQILKKMSSDLHIEWFDSEHSVGHDLHHAPLHVQRFCPRQKGKKS